MLPSLMALLGNGQAIIKIQVDAPPTEEFLFRSLRLSLPKHCEAEGLFLKMDLDAANGHELQLGKRQVHQAFFISNFYSS